MNLFVMKLLSKRSAEPVKNCGTPVSRIAGAVALAIAALAFAPAHAQNPARLPAPTADDQAAAISAADVLTAPPTGKESQDLPNIALSSQILFQVLAAEVALQRGQPAPAYQTYLALARDTHDPRFAQRATEIAIAAQSPNDALTAVQLWQQFAPNSDRAAQLSASLLIVSGKMAWSKKMRQTFKSI